MSAWSQIVSNFVRLDEAVPKQQPNAIPKGHKQCCACKEIKLLDQFYERKGHGSTNKCKICYAEYQAQLRKRKRAHQTPPNS